MWNAQLEAISRPELEKLQLQRLQKTLSAVAQKVQFYKESFKKAGFEPSACKSLSDLQKLPFTSKSDLRDAYPYGFLAVERQQIARIHASSGTRGKPTVACYTAADLEIWAEVCARSLAAAGARSGDVVHNSYGYGLFTGGIGIHQGAERLGATVVPASGGRTQQQIMLLTDFGARVLCCTPSYALNLSTAVRDNPNPIDLSLEIGIFGAEPWSEQCRKKIEEGLGIKAVDIYGLSEIIGPGVAIECVHAQQGLHIWEDHFLPEIIDTQTMEPVADDTYGELVITTLTKEGMPLVRYRTGDVCSMTHELCRCGRTMARLSRMKGRVDDMLIIRGVNVYPSEIESIVYSHEHCSHNYQILIGREKNLDSLTLRIELKDILLRQWQKTSEEATRTREVQESLAATMRDKLGLNVGIEVVPPHTIAVTEGKAMRVIDLRQEYN
jgi:phenylacetate-CoA ligase